MKQKAVWELHWVVEGQLIAQVATSSYPPECSTAKVKIPMSCYSWRIPLYYIDTDEKIGFLHLLKNHIFTARSEDTIFIFNV